MAPVVETLDSAIQRINPYPADKYSLEAGDFYCQKDQPNCVIHWIHHFHMGHNVLCLSPKIDLVTVFDAILTSRQTREKLQCLYENLMSNNFRRTAVLKKI